MTTTSEAKLPLNELITETLKAKPYQTFLLSLDSDRKELQDFLKKDKAELDDLKLVNFLTHQDFVIAEAAFKILLDQPEVIQKNSEPIMKVAVELVTHPDSHRRHYLALLLQKLDDQAVPVITNLLKDQSRWVQRGAIHALKNKSFDQVMPILEELWDQSMDEDALRSIVTTVHTYTNPQAKHFLEQAAQHKHQRPRNEAQALLLSDQIKASAQPEELIFAYLGEAPSTDVTINMVSALEKLREQALPLLEALDRSEHKRVAALVRANWSSSNWEPGLEESSQPLHLEPHLLWEKKSLFATKNPQELISLLNIFQEAVDELHDKLGDNFVGVVIHGSTAEGYRQAGSDVDRVLIVRDSTTAKVAKQYLIEKLGQRWQEDIFSHTMIVDQANSVDKKVASFIFQGIYFGNKSALRDIQKSTLEALTIEEWEDTRREIYTMIAGSQVTEKLKARHELTTSDLTIELNKALTKVPYDYETTLKLLTKNTKD